MTGTSTNSARRTRSAVARERRTPPPARITGRSASSSKCRIRRTCTGSGGDVRDGPSRAAPAARDGASATSSARRSSGRERSTGPGRPVVARRSASSSAAGSAAASRTSRAQRQYPPIVAARSTSWNPSRPRVDRSTWPMSAMTGSESALATWRPMARFAAPTARDPRTAVGWPLSAAEAAAMNAALPSWRVATTRIPAPTRPSRRGRKLSPGTVYATRTPAAASASATRRPAVRGVPVTDFPFLAGVGELERDGLVELAQPRDHLLEVVLALGAHTDGVALDLSLRLRELVPQDLRDLPGEVVREPAPQGDVLADLHPAGLLDGAPVEDLEREAAPNGFRLDQLANRLRPELRVGHDGERVLLLGDLRGRALEVEARGDLAPDLVQRVAELLGIELGDHIEGEFASHRFLRIARRARRDPSVVAASMPIRAGACPSAGAAGLVGIRRVRRIARSRPRYDGRGPLQEEFERGPCARVLVRLAVARPGEPPDLDPGWVSHGHVREADRLSGHCPGRARDPRDGHGEIDAQPRSRPGRHRPGGLRADGAVLSDHDRRHAQELLLDGIGVRHHAAPDVARRARHVRQRVDDAPARA